MTTLSNQHSTRRRVARWCRATALAGASVVVLACSPMGRDFGYAPSQAELDEIIIGIDTRDRVEELVGRPAVESLIQDSAWYYASSRQERFLTRAPVQVDRQVVAITFADDGTVQNIERFGLEDGRVIALNRRVTDANTQGVGFIRQLLGNIGNLNAETLAN